MSDRDLDRQVAEAMGWTNFSTDCAVLYGRLHGGPSVVVPRFATDFAALPEMLAWLWSKSKTRCDEPCLNITFSEEKSYVLVADCDREPGRDYLFERASMGLGCQVEKLPEAVCNLIVAVAAKEKP